MQSVDRQDDMALLAIDRIIDALDSMAKSQREMCELAHSVLEELKDAKSQSASTDDSQ